jgi:dUTP pyrophosphatase
MTLGGSTVILGLDWLKRHQPQIDFKTMEVDFISKHCENHCLGRHEGKKTIDVVEIASDVPINTIYNEHQFLIKKLTSRARMPERTSKEAAGLDLHSATEITIQPGERKLVPTDLAMRFPLGTYGRIASRSGIALKASVDTKAGVIDRDYRGNIQILLKNDSKDRIFQIQQGDRICQLILEKKSSADPIQVENLDGTQ